MRFMMFGGLGIVVYTGVTYARTFSGGCCGIGMPGGLEFAFLVSVEVLVTALVVSLGALVWWLPSARRQGPGLEGLAGTPLQEQECGPMVAASSATISCDGLNRLA